MKKLLQISKAGVLAIAAFLGFVSNSNAQCLAGEVAVSFDVTTDTYGYELYWELVPTGTACGTPATIFAGGNTAVGCTGGGAQASPAGGYANNTTVTEGPFCLTIGSTYDIIMVDDWADGGNTITSAAQGVNAVGAGATNTVTFTAIAPPTGADLAMSATPVAYTIYPLSQAANIVGGGTMVNNGAIPAGNSQMTVSVYDLGTMTQVYTETSAPQTIAVSGTGNFTVTGYTPTAVGDYYVEYIASTDSADANATNDTAFYIVQVDDSTYARDYANVSGVTGTLGIGAGPGQNSRLGQTFNLINGDTLTSVSIFIGNGNNRLLGQPLRVHIYATAAGVPTGSPLKTTETIIMDTTKNNLWTLNVQDGLVLPAGMYAVAVEENDSNISVGNTLNVFKTGSIYVKWDGNAGGAWTAVENFGAGFSKPFVIRPNFGVAPLTVGVKDLASTSFEVYPNPVVNSINVKNATVGSTVEIFNNLGQLVHTDVVRSNNLSIDVTGFDNGVYTIKNSSNDNVMTQSFVKQ
ncbi:MAG: T9SS type A sorting domain-containing protein [Flavobacteriales bacterium]